MRKTARFFRSAIGVLLAAALAFSPVAALGAPTQSAHQSDAMTADGGAPCDMPCDGCGDGQSSLSCLIACAGLAGSLLPAMQLALVGELTSRAVPKPNASLSGQEREPDKPPPKMILA
ncbi:MAG: hypothetical protein ACKVRO_05505 [Micropepsaceae bacterium]